LEFEVTVGDWTHPERLVAAVEATAAAEGLVPTMKGTLAGYPGCIHWHWKRGAERGVLEVTLWPSGRRLWLSIHANRSGAWTGEAAERLRAALQRRFQEDPPPAVQPETG
jgi:hypothetical protein